MSSDRTTRGRILIVEDEELLRWTIGKQLESAGYAVLSAESCREAREMVRNSDVDVLVTDYRLTDGFGPDLIPELVKGGRKIGVVLMTGELESISQEVRKSGGEMRTVSKPVRMAELLGHVEAILADSGSVRGDGKIDPVRVGSFTVLYARTGAELERVLGELSVQAGEMLAIALPDGVTGDMDLAALRAGLTAAVKPGRRLCLLTDRDEKRVVMTLCLSCGVDLVRSVSELEAFSRRLVGAAERNEVLSAAMRRTTL